MKKIVYAGLHKETLPLLYEVFEISAIAHIDFFCKKTLNPSNLIFKLIYFLRRKEKFRFLEVVLLNIWILVRKFASSVFYKYSDYLKLISKNKTKVLDFSNNIEVENYIKKSGVDLLVVNTWEMLPDNIVFSPKLGTINVHPSKLPKYRGALPTLWSLKNMDSESAITYMLLDKSMDGGKILKQCSFSLSKDDNWFSIEEKATKTISEMIVSVLLDYIEGKIVPYLQDNSVVSFTEKYEKYRKIDWENEKAIDIYNKVNLYPFVELGVFCYTYYGNRKIYIKGASFCEKSTENISKEKFFITGRYLCVNMKDGIIKMKLFRDLDFFSSLGVIFRKSNLRLDSNK